MSDNRRSALARRFSPTALAFAMVAAEAGPLLVTSVAWAVPAASLGILRLAVGGAPAAEV
jgi:hypothetical protein